MRLVTLRRRVLSAVGAPPQPREDWWRVQPIAHRGLHGEGRVENTLAAFDAAAGAGYPIELDVRAAADGAVVFHDATLDRLTTRCGTVESCTLDELGRITVGGTDQPIVSLQSTLEAVAGRTPLLVEVKNGGMPGRLEMWVADLLRAYRGPVAVQSFNPRVVRWFAQHLPEVDRGLLSASFRGEDLAAHRRFVLRRLALLPWCRAHFVGYELGSLPYWAPTLARDAGFPLLAWTIRTPGQLQRARRLADNIIFEHVRPGMSA
jgi:glycerophosphoryl diester phosphodiesterase